MSKSEPFLVGVVGGIGPAASLHMQQLILKKELRRCGGSAPPEASGVNGRSGFLADARHTPLLVYTNPQIPNNNRAALGIGPPSADALIESAVALKSGGADIVAFACTAAYTWMDEVSKGANVAVMDLLDLTANRVADGGHSKVGLLDVDGTIAAGAFGAAFERYGVNIVLPQIQEQELVMNAVAELKLGVSPTDGPLAALTEVASQLVRRDGASAVVMGCSEIAMAMGPTKSPFSDVQYIDTLDLLADEIVDVSLQANTPVNEEDKMFTSSTESSQTSNKVVQCMASSYES